jgi:hypothetical protein
VTIENGAAPGTYNGVFSALYDSDAGTGQETNFQAFSVTVVPEPTTSVLLGLALAGMMNMRSAKRAGG